jgi:hypothetical protein
MDYIFIENFFTHYSLPVLVIALCVGVVKFFLDRFFANKIPNIILTYCSFILCTLSYLAFDMIFVIKDFAVTRQSLYLGLLCGSVSVVFCTTIRKIVSGKSINLSQTVLLIEGLINGFVNESYLTATALELDKILSQNYSEETLTSNVTNTLKDNAHPHFSDDDLMRLSLLIIRSVNALKKGA